MPRRILSAALASVVRGEVAAWDGALRTEHAWAIA